MGAPTPRRSNRISTKASSVADTAVTNVTDGGTMLRRKGPLTKVKARKSNAYGASGRVGAAEELSVSATGFAQAFQNQRGDAFTRNHDEEEEDDDIDELGAETPRMSGALNGRSHEPSSPPEVSSRAAAGLSFAESEDDQTSVGNTSKSFGPLHEAGMLMPQGNLDARLSSPQGHFEPTPTVPRSTTQRTFQSRTLLAKVPFPAPLPAQVPAPARRTPMQPGRSVPAAANRSAIAQSVDNLVADEQARSRPDVFPHPPPLRAEERHRHPKNPQAVNNWLNNVPVPGKKNWTRIITWAFWGLLGAVLMMGLALSMRGSGFPESGPQTPSIASAVGARVSYTFGKVAEFIQPGPTGPTDQERAAAFRHAGGEDIYLWTRMSKINDTLTRFYEQLPPMMVIRRHSDGRMEITDDFWRALMSKVQSKEDDPEWNEYLKQEQQKLTDLFDKHAERRHTETFAQAVSRQEFIDTIAKYDEKVFARVEEKVFAALQTTPFKAMLTAEAKRVMTDDVRLFSLAQTALLTNYELHLRNPNYFSPGLGASVIPGLTSSTLSNNPGWWRRSLQKVSLSPLRNPPKVALQSWKQAGDCWCATSSPGNQHQAQLAVSLGRPMIPKKVTIEHVPMSMMPARKVDNAPRKVELWVETDAPTDFYYSERHVVCSEGEPGWKCLGSFNYNIHAANHVQTFALTAEPSAPITKAMVRVVNNWGADHTCMYQVRLHGDDADKDYDYEVHLNDE